MKGFFAIVIASLFVSTMFANAAPYFVNEDEAQGGYADEYLARIKVFREQGIKVHLPSRCASSCTLYTVLIRDGLVCSRKGDTQLVFHQFMRQSTRTVGRDGNPDSYWLDPPSREDVQRTWGSYPLRVKLAILVRSPFGLPELGEVVVSAREVGVPAC